mmetsp:Transcript_21743/g.65245  ORF Transcript_21743/g.65245 Transcript_21743/m.65245 type:complete len:265 (-) Transcript_21743:84-878(-)
MPRDPFFFFGEDPRQELRVGRPARRSHQLLVELVFEFQALLEMAEPVHRPRREAVPVLDAKRVRAVAVVELALDNGAGHGLPVRVERQDVRGARKLAPALGEDARPARREAREAKIKHESFQKRRRGRDGRRRVFQTRRLRALARGAGCRSQRGGQDESHFDRVPFSSRVARSRGPSSLVAADHPAAVVRAEPPHVVARRVLSRPSRASLGDPARSLGRARDQISLSSAKDSLRSVSTPSHERTIVRATRRDGRQVARARSSKV